jgi:hypothetical protein
MTPRIALLITAAVLVLLIAWMLYEYVAACRCGTCPRTFAIYKRGELYLCSACARMFDYNVDFIERNASAMLARAPAAPGHNNTNIPAAQTAGEAPKPAGTRVYLPRGATIAGKIPRVAGQS